MVLDIRTTIMIAAGLALLVGVSLRYVLRDYPTMLGPSMRKWMLGIFLQSTSWVLVELRDSIPDFVSIVIANALLSIGYAMLAEAVRSFVGSKPSTKAIYGLVALSIGVQIFFTYAVPDTRLRILIGTPLFAVVLLFALVPLIDSRQSRRRSYVLTASAFAALLAVMIVRFIHEGLSADALHNAFLATPMQAIVFCSLAFFPTVATLGFVLMCSDRLHQELERQATIDSLTGINNRRTLDQLAARAIALAHRHKRPLSVLLVDADHFKRINDAYGHEAGDEALQTLVATLQLSLRNEDLLGRLGGEEFVIVLPETDEAAAHAGAERLRVAVEKTEFTVQHRQIPLRVSIGIAVIDDNDDFAAMLRRADQAMYAAKRAGRNRVAGVREAGIRPVVVEGRFPG